eukprot:1143089-Pelagomonas_calceolata.AAC.19
MQRAGIAQTAFQGSLPFTHGMPVGCARTRHVKHVAGSGCYRHTQAGVPTDRGKGVKRYKTGANPCMPSLHAFLP